MYEKGYPQKDIAKTIKKDPSVVSRELKRNKTKGKYDPNRAQIKARLRRINASFKGKKIVGNISLRKFVEKALESGQSPKAISGRLKKCENTLPYTARDTIEKFVGSAYGKFIKLPWTKKKYRRNLPKKGRLGERIFIDERPKKANKRLRVGDVEADFIASGKSGRGKLFVVVCRKLRVAFLEKVFPETVDNVHEAFVKIQERFPEMKTATIDNDILFQMYKTLEKILGIKIYFCHPYHSWEKGSVENANRYIRKFIPKGSDISKVSKEEIQEIEKYLNDRWMECLEFRSPKEMLEEYRKKMKNKKQRGEAVNEWIVI